MNEPYINNDELMHYGVLGMKWGVRRGRAQQAYDKGIRTKQKLIDKAEKARAKSQKKKMKGSKMYLTDIGRAVREKQILKSNKLEGKALRYEKKAEKLQKNMDTVFRDTKVKTIPKETIDRGMRYVEKQIKAR